MVRLTIVKMPSKTASLAAAATGFMLSLHGDSLAGAFTLGSFAEISRSAVVPCNFDKRPCPLAFYNLETSFPLHHGNVERRKTLKHSMASISHTDQQQKARRTGSEKVKYVKRLRRIKKASRKSSPKHITSIGELDHVFSTGSSKRFSGGRSEVDHDEVLRSISVVGDTQIIGAKEHSDFKHPVLKLLHERRKSASAMNSTKISHNIDDFKIALSIEGGGMRGCVSAGMVAAIYYLGLQDCFDVVYGSSAGSLIGAYFITRQLPWFGPEVYYDSLTTSGKQFIDTKRLLRAVGLGLLDPRLLKDVITRPRHGKPVLDLSYLLTRTIQEKKPLDWDKFQQKQKDQPLKIIASGLKSEAAVVFDMERKSFSNIEELALCMHASMLLPGIAGPMMNIGRNDEDMMEFVIGNDMDFEYWNGEPVADALVYEPMPYRSALKEGATHVVVLRTRPDGLDVTGKPSVFSNMVMRRFFLRKNKLPNIYRRLKRHEHKKLYAEDVLILNEAANSDRDFRDTSSPHLMTIALPPGSPEITRLELEREAIFEGVRRGFARAYDALVEDPKERGRGYIVAKECFPDEILDYDPSEIDAAGESAFEVYLNELAADESYACSTQFRRS